MMNFSLYPHQDEFVSMIKRDLIVYHQIIACAATGAGKTKMFIKISYDAEAKGNATLIITESTKIFGQIIKERRATLIMAGIKYVDIKPGKVYVAMAQTLSKRPQMIQAFAALGKKLVVINDEAHVGSANKILHQLPDCYLIGFTATPDAKAAPHIPKIYRHVTAYEKMQPEWLVNNGYLTSYRHVARRAANLSELDTRAGEYTEESQEKVFSTRVVYDGLEKDLSALSYKKAIIYCSSIKHAENTFDELTNHGFRCCIVHSLSAPGQLEKFTVGDTPICVSVGILTKGFDFPEIDLVVLYRKTKSLPLYLQMCGRGSRTCQNKTLFTVLDYAENFMEHEYWITERDWVELAKPKDKKKKKKADAPPVKTCPACEALVPVSTRVCPFCQHEFSTLNDEPPPDSVLVDLTANYQTLKGKRLSELTPAQLATYVKITGKRQYGIRVARTLHDSQPGYLREYSIQMGYSKKFHHIKEKEPAGGFNDIIIR